MSLNKEINKLIYAGELIKTMYCKETDFDSAGVLQGDISAPYLFITCLDYILETSIDLIKALR